MRHTHYSRGAATLRGAPTSDRLLRADLDGIRTSRATVGEVIGNNSSRPARSTMTRSLDRTLPCRVALATGEILEMAACDQEAWPNQTNAVGRERNRFRRIEPIVNEHYPLAVDSIYRAMLIESVANRPRAT
ncbi:MAG: hypothetical protein AAF961_01470 [Planctomycetota bacterium]